MEELEQENTVGQVPQQAQVPLTTAERQERGELEAVPIYRANDLYEAMFEEVPPVFKRGEDPTAKGVFERLQSCAGKKVIFDGTCRNVFHNASDNEIEEMFGVSLAGLNGEEKYKEFERLVKEKLQVEEVEDSIEQRLSGSLEYGFSQEMIDGLIEIAKKKNPDIKRVVIVMGHLYDHFGDVRNQPRLVDDAFSKALAEKMGDAEVKRTLSVRTDPEPTDLIIVDRHSEIIAHNKLNKRFPKNVLLLPLETELHSNSENLPEGDACRDNSYALKLREKFEKSR